jgi:hypothetical protein
MRSQLSPHFHELYASGSELYASYVDKRSLTPLNVYGPFTERKSFWKKCADKGLLLHTDLILGDLNFTLNSKEIWGTSALLDPLATFFKDLFANTPLVDVALTYMVPTWRNGRMGESSISKRLDKILYGRGFDWASDEVQIMGGVYLHIRSCAYFFTT